MLLIQMILVAGSALGHAAPFDRDGHRDELARDLRVAIQCAGGDTVVAHRSLVAVVRRLFAIESDAGKRFTPRSRADLVDQIITAAAHEVRGAVVAASDEAYDRLHALLTGEVERRAGSWSEGYVSAKYEFDRDTALFEISLHGGVAAYLAIGLTSADVPTAASLGLAASAAVFEVARRIVAMQRLAPARGEDLSGLMARCQRALVR